MEQIITNQNDILKVQAELLKVMSNLDKSKYICTIKKHNPKRSLDANAYLWKLLNELSKVMKLSREDLYKNYIKNHGVMNIQPIKNEAKDTFINRWKRMGLGWFCEELGASKINDYTNIIAYFGTSTYDSKEMSRIVDAVVQDCKAVGIETLEDLEIKRLIENYGGKTWNKQ